MYKIDIEKLINEIEKRPALWDMKFTGYSDRVLKKQSWDELCILFGNEEMPETEKKELEAMLHKKWKNIRDNFSRDLQGKKRKSGNEGGHSKAPYMYSQQLRFLRDIIQSRETSNSLQESQQQLDCEDASSSSNTAPAQTPATPKIIKKKLQPIQNSLYKLDKSNSEMAQNDDNRYFLLSLLPSLSSLPKILNSKCRLEIMQIVHKYVEYALMPKNQGATYSPAVFQAPAYFDGRNTRLMQSANQVPQHHIIDRQSQALNSTINQFSYPPEDAVSPKTLDIPVSDAPITPNIREANPILPFIQDSTSFHSTPPKPPTSSKKRKTQIPTLPKNIKVKLNKPNEDVSDNTSTPFVKKQKISKPSTSKTLDRPSTSSETFLGQEQIEVNIESWNVDVADLQDDNIGNRKKIKIEVDDEHAINVDPDYDPFGVKKEGDFQDYMQAFEISDPSTAGHVIQSDNNT